MATPSADMHKRQPGPPPASTGAPIHPVAAVSRGHRKLNRETQVDAVLGRGLGWLSLLLGSGGRFAPSALGAAIGLPGRNALLRAAGARELIAGIGLLTQQQRKPWLWARVAGDVLDLTLLGMTAIAADRAARRRRSLTALTTVAAVTAVDVLASLRASRTPLAPLHASRRFRAIGDEVIGESVTLNKTPLECYQQWRQLEQLPRFMWTLESVRPLDERRSHWTLAGSHRTRLEWDAEITHDVPGERLAWRSLPNEQIAHAGVVRFAPAPGGRGTVVHLVAHYRLLAGAPWAPRLESMLTHSAGARLREELRRFKQLLETGEIATTEGQSHGARSLLGKTLQNWRSA
jgi:uncharacterized membrane protein